MRNPCSRGSEGSSCLQIPHVLPNVIEKLLRLFSTVSFKHNGSSVILMIFRVEEQSHQFYDDSYLAYGAHAVIIRLRAFAVACLKFTLAIRSSPTDDDEYCLKFSFLVWQAYHQGTGILYGQ
eukprot:TRINITY_DN10911_c0_g2_i1.p1 TRINITY_DN10911_c0_g2~~TRINITY_DN10911_c0_g2_i1.p1  ORF type:complete len:122 (+),score=10.82 TRINITY_DN10911_c0_g2_i1:556-921(+)